MIKTTYQTPEIRDANDNIIQQGAFGKNTALCNATNNGWIDYVMNNLEFLYDLAKDEVVPVPSLPASGQMNKTYLLTTTGVSYRWSGTQWVAVSSSEAVGRAETVANLAEQWATKTDGTVDGTEYSAKYYAQQAEQSADDAQDVADDMADHLVQIDKNTGGVSANSKRISNIEKLLQGNLYDYDTDDDVAYTKTVPSGALPYAGIEKLGGKTLVWNQLIGDPHMTDVDNWSVSLGAETFNKTITNNVLRFERSTTNLYNVSISCTTRGSAVVGHKYLCVATVASDIGQFRFYMGDGFEYINTTTTLTKCSAIITATTTAKPTIYIIGSLFTQGKYIEISNYCIFDLTLMFGSGNEPTTIEQFREMFPSDYYENNSGELLSAGVTEVVSKKADTTTLATYSVPAEIQALEGYGWSAGTAYNYIDYERRVFVKNVGKVDLGTLNWEYSNVTGHLRFYAPVSDIYISGSQVTIGNLIIDKYVTSSVQAIYINANDKICAPHNLSQVIWIYDSSYTDKTAFKSAMNGVYAYYQLANPIETDISAYLSDDNLIEVESSGTLTMYSDANGDDDAYHIPVPSEVTYMIDLQEAISNG